MKPDSLILHFPAVIKAISKAGDDKRMVSVEASSEAVDGEGDVILQSALMDSSESFIKTGHLDIDHLSEIGDRIGIPDPTSYIVGRPTEVKDLGNGRTGVVGEIRRSSDGKFDVKKNKFDAFWDSLQSDPPVMWRASIYGFPIEGGVDDCTYAQCEKGATRYLVKQIDWRSLAFTRNPVNTDLKGHAKIVTTKAYLEVLSKGGRQFSGFGRSYPTAAGAVVNSADVPQFIETPYNMDGLVGQYHRHIKSECAHTGGMNSTAGFKSHFQNCCMCGDSQADILAHALMHHLNLEKKRTE